MPVVSYARLWGLVAVYIFAAAMLYGVTGLSVDITGAGPRLAPMLLAAMVLFTPWLRGRKSERVADLAACWGLMAILPATGALISYPLVLGTQGWADPLLATMDRAIGFDWVSSYWFVANRPLVASMLALSYQSIFFSPGLVILGLTLGGKGGEARAFIFAFGIALAITLLLSHFFPARAALAYYLGTDVDFMPSNGIGHIEVIERLRAGTLTTIEIEKLLGLVTFPSFHAASAALFLWAGWGVRWLRVPITVVNIGMLIATPVHGTHYLVDVIAGVGVALVSIGILYLPRGLVTMRGLRISRTGVLARV